MVDRGGALKGTIALVALIGACSSNGDPEREPGSAGGSAAGAGSGPAGAGGAGAAGSIAAGSAGTASGGGSAGTGGSAGAEPACVADAPVDPAFVPLHLPLELVAGTTPFVAGEEFTTEGGTKVRAGIVAFFLSRAVLISSTGERVPARFADPAGVPRPYDLLLVNSMDATLPSVDLLARPGSYASLELGIGVPQACNHGDPTRAVFPLNASSGLYWTWATGYMFIRIEGQVESDDGWASFLYHVGFDAAYRTVTLTSPLSVPVSATAPRLRVDVSRALAGTTTADTGLHVEPDFDFADRFAAPGTLALAP